MQKFFQKDNQLDYPKINIILYSLLLVLTPFLMLQNYLQSTLKGVSNISFTLFDQNIPLVLIIFSGFFLSALFLIRKKLNTKKLIYIFLLAFLFWLGQRVSDYYINYKFYDLQNNWHYIAYSLLVFLVYSKYKEKEISYSSLIKKTFIHALIISLFDEGIQVFISNRIFDLSDVAKDMWGVICGFVLFFFIFKDGEIIKEGIRLRFTKISDYWNQDFSTFFQLAILTFIFLNISALLTEESYILELFFLVLTTYIIIFLLFHYSQFKLGKYLIIPTVIILFTGQTILFFSSSWNDFSLKKNIISYHGLTIPYFDFLIYPDNSFRLVDKKKHINRGDLYRLSLYEPDVLLISSGFDNSGAKGLVQTQNVEYPKFLSFDNGKNVIQIGIFENDKISEVYKKLKEEDKKVMILIHNN